MEYVGIQSQIRNNNIRSTILLILFPCIVLILTWLFFFILAQTAVYGEYNADGHTVGVSIAQVNSMAFPVLPWMLVFCGIWFMIAYFIHSSMIKRAVHAHPLSRKDNKKVYNLLENLCIANGMKMPNLNIVDDDSLNAFASGINDNTYTITLTRGIIDQLDDNELEGVIAHELTHIRNRDVRLLIVSIIFVGIFAFVAQVALRSIGRISGKKDKAAALIIIVLILAGIGYLISTLMRFAVSRKREYMADAGSAFMTQKPWALASALRKISKNSRIDNLERDDVAQLFIEHSSNAAGITGKLFATHPPIEKRIAVLEQF